jgi:hypothetical protein
MMKGGTLSANNFENAWRIYDCVNDVGSWKTAFLQGIAQITLARLKKYKFSLHRKLLD